ncbi:hypothetical protein N0V87_000420 [Didymella glomerata]|uniref:DUF7587 domain-containing protein n=1 Tax=Didymella glomerata TaxID=749621 RepID=A0A9W8X8W1_9PLEO|nr:hypothetical protein N0V87_000420 [Didymella glomerata]
MDTEWARDALKRHVTKWDRKKHDNLMSWTSSPLFALQHAIRREATDRNPPSTARQVKLSILFTSKLPAGCFVPSVALLDAYDAHYNADMQRRYYHGEYLSQVWGSITEETFIEAVESSQEVPEHSQFVQLMNHFQEQERERIQQFKFKSGLEVEQDITSALDKLQTKAEIEFALCMFADYTMEGDIW